MISEILTEGQSVVRCPFLLKMTCNDVSILRMTCVHSY